MEITKTKYKLSKFKEEIKEGESEHEIAYRYNNGYFRIRMSAKDVSHARQRFLEETNGDWCDIHRIKKI